MACTDVNECLDPTLSGCATDATCSNSAGGFTCTCNAGFSGDGFTCTKNVAAAMCPSDQCWNEAGSDCELKSNAECGHALLCGADHMSFSFPEELFGITDPSLG